MIEIHLKCADCTQETKLQPGGENLNWSRYSDSSGSKFNDRANGLEMPEGWSCWSGATRCPECHQEHVRKSREEYVAKKAAEAAERQKWAVSACASEATFLAALEEICGQIRYDSWNNAGQNLAALLATRSATP